MLLLSFLLLGLALGCFASWAANRDAQHYSAPRIEAAPIKFFPQSMTCPK